ncbi:hypothetical protein ACFQGE_18700 [Halomicroarcula sp. GCM10025817]|uniref:hypothetical protein n=1 Tax=Haloarcula TaxID=2237 RepID=UPI0023E864A1|nr:hypothetical protein [Halomicroarcula sp. SYNS111]
MVPAADCPPEISRLLEDLRADFGDGLRSCVEYAPSKNDVYYLRDDIDETVAHGRLVRVEELYQSERVGSVPVEPDEEMTRLHAATFLFDEVLVIHLVGDDKRVVGFSVDASATPDLSGMLSSYLETVFDPGDSA